LRHFKCVVEADKTCLIKSTVFLCLDRDEKSQSKDNVDAAERMSLGSKLVLVNC
jgi:hypothetical protein